MTDSEPNTGVKAVVRQIAPIPVIADRRDILFLLSIVIIFSCSLLRIFNDY
ncbi:hypothetical protein GCM10011518_34400 [Flavobacterium limi]|uniref:Uncharacterized protein n=1 Tax=Flavobacterium limi TaxID=2045105 RepID=A0ABQ1UQ18_9FLAO|nr:hypothetical protein GCM10011518_34400 [Flavobacterium limi]